MALADLALAPVTLVSGTEALFAERAVDRAVALAREAAAAQGDSLERVDLAGPTYEAGRLSVAASPSLFAEPRVVVVDDAQLATDALVEDVTAYVAAPEADVSLVVVHRGGQRGKRMLDAIKASGAPVVVCDAIKKDSEKEDFVRAEMRAAGRRVDAPAVQALVGALGSDLRELASACAQLVADTSGTITESVVDRYYGGRQEVTGFKVADAAAAGRSADAVTLLRHAVASGVDPVVLVAALALKLRQLAKVAATRSSGGPSPQQLGLAPWQVDRARKELTRWTPEGLATAITAVARADEEVKGGSRDPVFAVERAVLTVSRATGR
ncbi:DNA polymerase III subunit delta [Luteimicrobium subarcticum]|uniref:DNA-directed DNA polymerase n=1 Tax=Luteimicrobium subarcticum TaxID=620910 RepID=A0A2M8WQY8_9MICO|nr:DNA polymerase III subunit delta [Luteimicrobium subarcticum]PJI93343.1 DNA polymerase III delta subunit [Luteimicrobium subarcticum]